MQTSVESDFTPSVAGMMSDSHTASAGDRLSYTSEEASAGIPFGVCVAQGSEDRTALLVATTADVLIGIAMYANDLSTPQEVTAPDDGVTALDPRIQPGVTFSVLRRGRIWVRTEENVAPGDAVRVRGVISSNDTGYLDSGHEVPGAFRTTADDTTDCTDISAFARWVTSGSAGGLAELEVDFTNAALSNPD